MKIRDLVVLDEVTKDLTDGKLFYDKSEIGIGAYFQDSIIADVESLFIYAGVHSKFFVLPHDCETITVCNLLSCT